MYKVVSVDDIGRRYSAWINKRAQSFPTGKTKLELLSIRLQYSPGYWVRPMVGKIFIFEHLDDANEWARAHIESNYEIWEVDYENAAPATRIASVYYWASEKSNLVNVIRTFWNGHLPSDTPPIGAWEADAVRLVRQVN